MAWCVSVCWLVVCLNLNATASGTIFVLHSKSLTLLIHTYFNLYLVTLYSFCYCSVLFSLKGEGSTAIVFLLPFICSIQFSTYLHLYFHNVILKWTLKVGTLKGFALKKLLLRRSYHTPVLNKVQQWLDC